MTIFMKVKKFIAALKSDPVKEQRLKSLSKERAGLTRYLAYLDSPWKIIWTNFYAGVASGFGFLVGAAVVIGILGYVVKVFLSQIPFVGEFFQTFYDWLRVEVEVYKAAR